MLTIDEQRDMIAALRQKTGEGVMCCHKALRFENWDFEKAVEHLRNLGNCVNRMSDDNWKNC